MSDSEHAEYFIKTAYQVAKESNCLRGGTGAVLVVRDAPVLQACNGTPLGATPCSEGGCPRCASDIPSRQGYESCACVHAEANVVALAARAGIQTEGGKLFCTLRPCLGCLKLLIQAGVREVVFAETFTLDEALEGLWKRLALESGVAVCHQPLPSRH